VKRNDIIYLSNIIGSSLVCQLGEGYFQPEVKERDSCLWRGTADWLTQRNGKLSIGTSRREQASLTALWVRH